MGRSFVWHQIGVLNNERGRYAHAEDAYARSLTLKADKAETYFARAKNQAQWGLAELEAGHHDAGIEHLRQARVHAVTSLAMNYPTAQRLLKFIEDDLAQFGAAGN
jgi:hypothetical protein